MLGFPLFLVLFFCFVLFFSHITKKNSANLFYQNVKYERVDVMPLMLTLYFATAARSSKNSVSLFYQNVKYERVDFMSTAARRSKNSVNSFYQNVKYETVEV